MPEIKHIWFDFDGTLTIETPAYKQAHDEFAAGLFAELMGINDLDEALSLYLSHRKREGLNTKVFENVAGMNQDFWATKLREWDSSEQYDAEEHTGIAAMLGILAASMPVSIYTNTSLGRLQVIAQRLSYPLDVFEHIVPGDAVPEMKPSVRAYEYIIDLSGVAAGENMYVGDRVSGDIIPAKAAGMQTVLVGTQSDEADWSIEGVTDLPELLQQIS